MSKNRRQLVFGIDEDEQERWVYGMKTEDRFFEAAHAINYEYATDVVIPDYLLRIDRASVIDDLDGVDAIVYTRLGEIPIQIKSSLYRLEEFKLKHPDFEGIMMAIPEEAEKSTIIEATLWGVRMFVEAFNE